MRSVAALVGVGKDQTTGQPGVGFDPSRTVVTDLTVDNEVQFRFLQGSHRVVQSDFNSPCSPNGGFDSGAQDVAAGTSEENGPTATFTIPNNTGVYYFSDIGNNAAECYLGAVFCLNTDEGNNDGACHTFQSAALALGEQYGVTANTTTSTAAPVSASSTAASSSSTGMSSSGSTTSSASRSSGTSAPSASPSSQGGTSGAAQVATFGTGIAAAVVAVVAAVTF
ncbi:hypothetical protein JCM10212_000833 [Sporobolomyces blumeae]